MPDLRHRPWIVASALVLLLGASAGLQAARDRMFPRTDIRDRFLYLQSGKALERVSLSFDSLAADVYWIRTLQHYGGDRLSKGRQAKYELLYPLLDLTTSLDPRFTIAYRFGAIFLAEPWPGGPGRPDLAVALLKKGLAHDPTNWQYMQDIGFVHYWALRDFRSAAGWFRRGSQVAGAPGWLEPLAAATLARGGDRAASRFLWEQIAATAQDDWMTREAERRLTQLVAMDQIDLLDARIARFAAANSDGPLTWARLVGAGLLGGVPVDPTGVPYVLNAWWGTVTVSEDSRLFPLPTGEAVRVEATR